MGSLNTHHCVPAFGFSFEPSDLVRKHSRGGDDQQQALLGCRRFYRSWRRDVDNADLSAKSQSRWLIRRVKDLTVFDCTI